MYTECGFGEPTCAEPERRATGGVTHTFWGLSVDQRTWLAFGLAAIAMGVIWDIARKFIKAREKRETIKATVSAAKELSEVITALALAMHGGINKCHEMVFGVQDAIQQAAKAAPKVEPHEIIGILRPAVFRAMMFLVSVMDLLDKCGLGHETRAAIAHSVETFGFADPLSGPRNAPVDVEPLFESATILPAK
jgi:hypothetical protein